MRSRGGFVSLVVAVALVASTISVGAAATMRRSSTVIPAATATYGSKTGVIPLSQACGSRVPVYAVGGMAAAKALGVSQVRCDLNWWTVQPHDASHFDWTVYDNAVNAAAHFGIKLMFTVSYTPPWARPNPLPSGTIDASHVPPANVLDLLRFVIAAVRRYSPTGTMRVPTVVGSVSNWEIWNEPNIAGGWNPVDPVRYGHLLTLMGYYIHAIDHGATVILGGMAPAVTAKGNLSPQDFIAKVAPTGALALIDAVAVHPYTFPAYPTEKISFNPMYQMVPQLYKVMSANGLAAKKIWATEVGWPTSSQSLQTLRPWDHIQVGTETYQAVELPLSLVTWFKLAYAGPLFIYAERDRCTDNRNWTCKMGVERTDGSRKPAWTTVNGVLAKPIQ